MSVRWTSALYIGYVITGNCMQGSFIYVLYAYSNQVWYPPPIAVQSASAVLDIDSNIRVLQIPSSLSSWKPLLPRDSHCSSVMPLHRMRAGASAVNWSGSEHTSTGSTKEYIVRITDNVSQIQGEHVCGEFSCCQKSLFPSNAHCSDGRWRFSNTRPA